MTNQNGSPQRLTLRQLLNGTKENPDPTWAEVGHGLGQVVTVACVSAAAGVLVGAFFWNDDGTVELYWQPIAAIIGLALAVNRLIDRIGHRLASLISLALVMGPFGVWVGMGLSLP